MWADYFKYAIGTLRKRKLRSWLTMIGIFIGIAAIVSLLSLGEGLRVAITSQFGFLSADVLSVQAGGMQMGPPGTGVITPFTIDDAKTLSKVQGVEAAIPRLVRSGTLEYNDKLARGYSISVPSGKNRKIIERVANLEVDEGRLLRDEDSYGLVLGATFKEEDIFGKPISVGQQVLLNGKKFKVLGILEKKGSFMVDGAVIMNEDIFRELEDDNKKADIIVVVVKNQKEMDLVQERVEKLLRKERNVDEGEEDFDVTSPQAAVESLNDTLFAVQLFVYIIAGISLLVGGIGIMNTMNTAVIERTKEIGIMKSIGAKNKDIFMLFFIESGFLGSAGGIIGTILGSLIAISLSALANMGTSAGLIQTYFPWWLIPGAILFSFLVGSIAGITPALSAARLKPVDALRAIK